MDTYLNAKVALLFFENGFAAESRINIACTKELLKFEKGPSKSASSM
jgi:hypothetical protein